MVVVLDMTSTTMLNNMTQENTSLSTRRSVKFKGKDEKISDVEIDTAFIREPALPGAAVRETANSEETLKYRVNTAFIRGPALPGAAVRETANSEETLKYRVNTAFIRGPALPGAAVRETANSEETSQKMVLTSHIRERTATAVKGGELHELPKLHEKAKLHEKTKLHEKAKSHEKANQLLCQTLCTHSNLQEDAMLDSVEVKEEIEDAKRNIDNLFLSTKVNLLFLLIVLLWIFLLKKCIILNTVFLVHNIMILAGVYATLMGVNFCVNFLMSSTRAAMNTLDECDLFEKAMQFSVIAHDDDDDDDDDDDESFLTKNCRSR